ncbi:MAG: flap endonuclease-1 [Nitrososphaeraceae archaeon]
MGLDLKPILSPLQVKFNDLVNKTVAIDAFNAIYQFLATIRGPTGDLLANSKGEVTSHLSGLFYRNINLISYNIRPIYVFDGKPSYLKFNEIERRQEIKKNATEKYEQALIEGRIDEAKKYSQATSVLTEKMIDEAKILLSYLGIPVVQAPSEGEAAAAYLTNIGLAHTTASQDYDSILFGTKQLIRNLTISGKRKIPNRNMYIDIPLEMFHIEDVLSRVKLSREQLVDVGILIGTDFNPGGVPRIGPKKALKLIQQYSRLEHIDIDQVRDIISEIPYKEIREIFLHPENPTIKEIKFSDIEYDKIIEFLCQMKDFSNERVNSALQKVIKKDVNQIKSLDNWL